MTTPIPGAYNNAATSVGNTTPTLIATVSSDGGGVLVQNNGSVVVYLGGANVAASGANTGFALTATGSAGNSVLVPSVGSTPNNLFAIAASSTATVVVLFPSGS